MKEKYYTLNNILAYNADYNIIYGERSNGKTTAVLRYALEDYIKSNYTNQLAIVRRWEEDFKGKMEVKCLKVLLIWDGLKNLLKVNIMLSITTLKGGI